MPAQLAFDARRNAVLTDPEVRAVAVRRGTLRGRVPLVDPVDRAGRRARTSQHSTRPTRRPNEPGGVLRGGGIGSTAAAPRAGVAPRRSDRSPWNWLLLLPIVVPLLVPLYNKVDPVLFGWPLFYWLQLAFVALGVVTTSIVYRMTRRSATEQQAARDAIARDSSNRDRER